MSVIVGSEDRSGSKPHPPFVTLEEMVEHNAMMEDAYRSLCGALLQSGQFNEHTRASLLALQAALKSEENTFGGPR